MIYKLYRSLAINVKFQHNNIYLQQNYDKGCEYTIRVAICGLECGFTDLATEPQQDPKSVSYFYTADFCLYDNL